MTLVAHLGAAGLYALAGAVGMGPRGARSLLPWLLAAGAAAHVLGFLGLHLESPPVPLESTAAALSLIGWIVVSAYLLSLGAVAVSAMGSWVGLGAAVLTLCAAIGLRFYEPAPVLPVSAGGWPHAHVILSAAGFALLALSGTAGAAYLVKERVLKRKRHSGLPSLESLDRLEHAGLSFGFPLLTLGVLSGYAWVFAQGGNFWSPHALFLLLAWLVFLVPVGLRVVLRERGPRASRSVVLGFAILAFSYFGIRLLGGAA